MLLAPLSASCDQLAALKWSVMHGSTESFSMLITYLLESGSYQSACPCCAVKITGLIWRHNSSHRQFSQEMLAICLCCIMRRLMISSVASVLMSSTCTMVHPRGPADKESCSGQQMGCPPPNPQMIEGKVASFNQHCLSEQEPSCPHHRFAHQLAYINTQQEAGAAAVSGQEAL